MDKVSDIKITADKERRNYMLNKLHYEMIKLYNGDAKRIQHFCKVHSYAKLIAEMENVDEHTLFIIEAVLQPHEYESFLLPVLFRCHSSYCTSFLQFRNLFYIFSYYIMF